MPSPVDREDAGVNAVKNKLQCSFLVLYPLDQVGQGRVVLQHGEAAFYLFIRAVDRNNEPGHHVFCALPVDDFNVRAVRSLEIFTLVRAPSVTRNGAAEFAAVFVRNIGVADSHDGPGAAVEFDDMPVGCDKGAYIQVIENLEPFLAHVLKCGGVGKHGGLLDVASCCT
jgi:hypothetical protein